MVEKAPDAFRNISEAAKMLGIPAHVLRFWETRFVQIKPVKRSGGRRYYRPDDIALLKRIHELLYDKGYTIKGAQQVLKQKTASATADMPKNETLPMNVKRAIMLLKEAHKRLSRLENSG